MNVYVFDHYQDFPQSEYGGMWAVVAQDVDQCIQLVVDKEGELAADDLAALRENVECSSIAVAAPTEEPRILGWLIT